MASSSRVVTAPLKQYEVFISFRGEDTRTGFTSFLHAALRQSRVETYIDYRLGKGDEVWPELVKAIKASSVFLVVFSENYASSTWCLNELVEIMKCKKSGQDNVVVIPVFYQIDPSHVRKQTGSYHTALAQHKKHGEDKIQKWKDALFEAANLSGFHTSTYETEFELIEAIMKEVSKKLNHKWGNEFRCDFISDENYSSLESLIKNDSRQVRIIGLWGMGGIGKTTLAAAVYHTFSSQYEGSCFLPKVTEGLKRHDGLNHICERLFSTLLKEDIRIDTPKVIPSFVMRRLKCMKVFIVLDGLNTSELLGNLVGVGHDWLGAGSRVIVTTRDKDVLSGRVDQIHKVREMNFQNSLRLFSLNAFHKTYPAKGYEELSKRAIVYAKGIPLALKVLGSFLRCKSTEEWNSALIKLKEIPNAKIQEVLKLSYDELDYQEKNIFLDIACFFKGYTKDNVTKILNDCGFYADIGIRNLLDKALIRVDLKNCIEMHDLIQEMGREIVRKEFPTNPGQRSRLWDPKEVCDVLTNNRGSRAVEAIFLDATQLTLINLSFKSFNKMPNLRLLAFKDDKGIKSISLPRGLDLLPKNLRYFGWDGYPLKFLPLNFCAEMLVVLSLRDSNVEKLWNGVQSLPKLETLCLSGSKRLIECPNLSGAPNLIYVKFDDCERLPLVDPSIFSLQKLEVLDVGGCTSLRSLSSNTCPPSLRNLHALSCFNLQEFSIPILPNIASTNRFMLALDWGLNGRPPSILHLRNLDTIVFPVSDNLMDLPENFARTICLGDRPECTCDILVTLRKVLPSPAFLSVRRLVFLGSDRFSEIPDNISMLSSLQSLALYRCAIISLPQTIKHLPRLKILEISECRMLRSIPVLPQSIQRLRVWNCESLQTVSSSTSEPFENFGCGFVLINCIKLDLHSYDTFLKDAIVRIEIGARLHSATSESKEDASFDHDDRFSTYLYRNRTLRSSVIWYFLPAMTVKVRYWFHYHSTQAFYSGELPPNLLGVAYYLVLSQGRMGCGERVGCECYLETSSGEWINMITSFVGDEIVSWFTHHGNDTPFNMMSDHVLLWYDAQFCEQIRKAVEERKAINDVSTSYSPKLRFRFFVEAEKVVIKECGFRWICPSEPGGQIVVEEGGRCKPKRKRKFHELEASAVQNRAEGSESGEQEETIAPTKKIKQCVFGTPSNLEAQETEEDLRGETQADFQQPKQITEEPIGEEAEVQARPKRHPSKPVWMRDYVC